MNGRARASTTGGSRAQTNASVRRDLFASQLTRRGPHAPMLSSSLAENAAMVQPGPDSEPRLDDGSEIVVRDLRTEMVLDPSALVLEDREEIAAIDERQEHESK